MQFSVVLVTYNRIELLKECIQHIQEQTIPFGEVIIVNNASTDGTKEFLKDFDQNSNFIVKNLKSNGGGAAGFHEGIKIAANGKGDWILLIDDDAILSKNYVEKIQEAILEDGIKKAYAYAGTVQTEGQISIDHRAVNLSKYIYKPSLITKARYQEAYFLCDYASFCGLFIEKKIIKKIGLPESDYFIRCDDFEYSMRIAKYSKIKNVNAATLNHKTQIAKNEKDLTWKAYYTMRNGIHAAGKHFGKFGRLELIWRYRLGCIKNILIYGCIKKTHSPKYIFELYQNAITDGIHNHLGMNPKYAFGLKS